MLPLAFNDMADCPTIVLSPHQHQFDPISSRASHTYLRQPQKPFMPYKPWDSPSMSSSSASNTHSKKRSHDDTGLGDKSAVEPLTTVSTPLVSPDAVHGSCMPIKDPMTGCEKAIGTQPGVSMQERLIDEHRTVVEGKLKEAFQPTEASDECSRSSAKRQRQESPSLGDSVEDPKPLDSSPSTENISPKTPNFAHLIGIGWSAIGEDPDTLSAWRGIAKAIEKSNNLTNVTVVARNQSVDACLVNAAYGWHLVRTGAGGCQFLAATQPQAFRRIPEALSKLDEHSDPENASADNVIAAGANLQDALGTIPAKMEAEEAEEIASRMDID